MGSCLFMRKGDVHTAPGALPLGCSALEYIQSTGTQYIDTGFKHNQNTRVVIKAQVTTQPSSHAWLFEGRESGVSHKSLILLNGNTWNTDYKSGVMDGHRIAYSSVGVTDLLNIDYNKNVTNINGNTHTYEVESFQSNYNLTLFAANTAGNVAGFISAKMWYCQIYDNGVLVRDFIPCKNAEGVAGMLDLVEKKFYPSASDTAFVEPIPEGLPAIGTALNDMTWEEVRAISDAGMTAYYFAVGDTKTITLNGTVGTVSFNNLSVDAYIIGIDHNVNFEGNGIHFQLGRINGVDVALVDSKCDEGASSNTKYFHMNSGSSNSGWESCKMRKTILGNNGTPYEPIAESLLGALPVELRSVIKTVTKYTDNVGDEKSNESNITGTNDYIFLLSEFELFGTRNLANTYEQNYQEQYSYYAAGNSRMKYQHNATTSLAYYWLRSPSVETDYYFCYVKCVASTGTTVDDKMSYYSFGVAPVFVVGGSAESGDVTLISFTIGLSSNTVEYQCEAGMTWAEWCSSKYNVDGYHVIGTSIHPADTTSTDGWYVQFAFADNVIEAKHYDLAL